MTTISRKIDTRVSAAELGEVELERRDAVDREVLRLAVHVVQKAEFNDSHKIAVAALSGATPTSLGSLVSTLANHGASLQIRRVNYRGVRMAPFHGAETKLLDGLLRPVATEMVRRAATLEKPLPPPHPPAPPLAPGDPGAAELEEAGLGILGHHAPLVWTETFDTSNSGDLLSSEPDDDDAGYAERLHHRATQLQALNALRQSLAASRHQAQARQRANKLLEQLARTLDNAWESSPDSDVVSVRVVRGVLAALAPAGVAIRTHRRLVFSHSGYLMEAAKLVQCRSSKTPAAQRDLDGARFERILQAVRRFERLHGKGSAFA